MLILDLKLVFDLVQLFKRILQFKWRPPKVLFSGLFSKFECMISLLVSFSKYGALYQNWPFLKVLSPSKSILTNTGGQKRYLQFFFPSLAKFRNFLATSSKPELFAMIKTKEDSLFYFFVKKRWLSKKFCEISELIWTKAF